MTLLQRTSPQDGGLLPDRVQTLRSVLQDEIDRQRLPGAVALIARGGRIGLFESFGRLDPAGSQAMGEDAIFRIYSMSKPITTVAAMMLVEEGIIPKPLVRPVAEGVAHSIRQADQPGGKRPTDVLQIERIISDKAGPEATLVHTGRSRQDMLAAVRVMRLRTEVLAGTWEALISGQADLALGVSLDAGNAAGIHGKPLGGLSFVFAVAPHHPLANAPEPLGDALLQQHRAVAVADSVQRGSGVTIGLLGGQDVFTVPSMLDKFDAQLRGLGCGFVPEPMARPFLETGRLVARRVERPARVVRVGYAWRGAAAASAQGRALQWWLQHLESPATRTALLERHRVE